MKKKRLSWMWFIIVVGILMCISLVYEDSKGAKFIDEYRQTCSATTNNEADFNKCVEFKVLFERGEEYAFNTSTFIAIPVCTLILFLILRYVLDKLKGGEE